MTFPPLAQLKPWSSEKAAPQPSQLPQYQAVLGEASCSARRVRLWIPEATKLCRSWLREMTRATGFSFAGIKWRPGRGRINGGLGRSRREVRFAARYWLTRRGGNVPLWQSWFWQGLWRTTRSSRQSSVLTSFLSDVAVNAGRAPANTITAVATTMHCHYTSSI